MSVEARPETIPAVVMASVERFAQEVAVVDDGRRVSYRELGDLVIDSMRAMITAGVGRGDRVAVWAPNGLGWIVSALGAQCAGGALVPINTRWKGAESAYLLARSRAKVLCTSVGFLGTDTVAMLDEERLDEERPDHARVDDDSTTLAGLERIVLLEGSDQVGARLDDAVPVERWKDFVAQGVTMSDREAHARIAAVLPGDTSDTLFTSGTTGRPKGVVMTHAQTVRQFGDWCDSVGLTAGDRYLIVNPFFHMFGYKAGWFAALIRGATIYPVPVFDVPAVLSLIERERITFFPGAPTIYRSILDHPSRTQHDLSSLRVAVTGAADIPVELIRQIQAELPFKRIFTGYGLTEAGTCTLTRPDNDAEAIATTVGRPMPELDIIIADADGHEVERGETGELLVRGFSVMHGYLDDPEATAAAIDHHGFLHTGDLATMDANGSVRIVGRLKDMFIVGGFNVYPVEIENVLLGHQGVSQAAVIGIPDERMGEVGLAFVVPGAGASIDGAALIAWMRERLANYKVPRSVRVVASMPINATGKVMKEELRAQAIM